MGLEKLRASIVKYRNDIVLDILKANYIPSAIKGVEIPKGNGQVRLLGVPTVVDRWQQQAGITINESKLLFFS